MKIILIQIQLKKSTINCGSLFLFFLFFFDNNVFKVKNHII